MKDRLFRYATATIAMSVAAVGINSTAVLAGQQDFIVRNQTDVDIVRLYVSISNTNDWEEDVLGSDVIESGTAAKINFNDSTPGCYHDLKAVFRDGDVLERRSLNLCRLRSYTFTN